MWWQRTLQHKYKQALFKKNQNEHFFFPIWGRIQNNPTTLFNLNINIPVVEQGPSLVLDN